MTWQMSDENKTQLLNKTVSPALVLTDSSSYTPASDLSSVLADEVSGNGYVRPPLVVTSNSITDSDIGMISYGTVTITASGGAISYDRIVLIADSSWVAYREEPGTIPDGETGTFKISWGIGQQGGVSRGADGISAYTITTSSFVQPSVGQAVVVNVEEGRWADQLAPVFFSDGINTGQYEVSTAGTTSLSLKSLGGIGTAIAGTVMNSGGSLAPTGKSSEGGFFSWIMTLTLSSGADPVEGEVVVNSLSSGLISGIEMSETGFFRDSDTNPYFDLAEVLDLVPETSLIRLTGTSSGTIGIYRLTGRAATLISGGDASLYSDLTVSFQSATGASPPYESFLSGERVLVSCLPAQILPLGTPITTTGTFTPTRSEYLRVDAASGNVDITFGQVTTMMSLDVVRIDGTANTVNLTRTSLTTLGGQASLSLAANSSIRMRYNESTDNWET